MGRTISCLKDRIGLRSVAVDATPTPDSGMFLEQLPGMELKMLNEIADVEQSNYVGVWDDVQERALRQFALDINTQFKKKYKLQTVTQSVDIGREIDQTVTTPAGANYQGYTLELNRVDDTIVDSNMQAIYVKNFQFFSDFAGTVNVRIFDLDLDTQLFTNAFTAVVGWNTVSVEETFLARRLFLAYDATNIIAVTLDINNLQTAVNNRGGCDCAYFDTFSEINCGVEIRGATAIIADEPGPFTVTFASDTFGASGIWSVHCTYENLVCNNLPVFDNAFLYLLGIHVMQERQYTNRLNEWTVFNRNRAQELEALYSVYYQGGVIERAETEIAMEGFLTQAVAAIDLNQLDACIECNSFITHRDAII